MNKEQLKHRLFVPLLVVVICIQTFMWGLCFLIASSLLRGGTGLPDTGISWKLASGMWVAFPFTVVTISILGHDDSTKARRVQRVLGRLSLLANGLLFLISPFIDTGCHVEFYCTVIAMFLDVHGPAAELFCAGLNVALGLYSSIRPPLA